jgi:hypothetical protein
MADERSQHALSSATPESRERAGAGEDHPGEGPAIVFDDRDEQDGQVDGAADTGPGTMPEGATPKVPRTAGDPLADAHDDPDSGRQH